MIEIPLSNGMASFVDADGQKRSWCAFAVGNKLFLGPFKNIDEGFIAIKQLLLRVGVAEFESATSSVSGTRSNQLS